MTLSHQGSFKSFLTSENLRKGGGDLQISAAHKAGNLRLLSTLKTSEEDSI